MLPSTASTLSPAQLHDSADSLGLETESAVRMLRESGFDAFLCSSAASLKGGVSVRVAKHDPHVSWTAGRAEVAPVGCYYSSYGDSFVIHAGRVETGDDLQRLQDFVASLTLRAQAVKVA